jgi:hypothetical protein
MTASRPVDSGKIPWPATTNRPRCFGYVRAP